jgi:hypothetical protein
MKLMSWTDARQSKNSTLVLPVEQPIYVLPGTVVVTVAPLVESDSS